VSLPALAVHRNNPWKQGATVNIAVGADLFRMASEIPRFEHLRLYGHAATKATKVMACNEQDVVVLATVTICSTPNLFSA